MGGRRSPRSPSLPFPAQATPQILEADSPRRRLENDRSGLHCRRRPFHPDDEIKFGYAVTGTIHPDKIWTNAGARPGDVLLLTKPLGTGVISTAIKQQKAQPAWIAAATAAMTTLNRAAADALHELESQPGAATTIHAVTDVTGFGFLGHAREMAIGSGVSFDLHHDRFAYLEGAIDAARAGFFSAGMNNNRDFVEGCATFAASVPDEYRALLFDPQTAGGLLIAVAPAHADQAIAALKRNNVDAHAIGSVQPKGAHLLSIS